jgi:hypothetical protein
MAYWTSDFTSTGWFRALAWTLGVPLVVCVIVLGTAAVAQRYAHLVASVAPTLNPFNRPCFTEHRKRNNRIVWSLYIFTMLLPSYISQWILSCCLAALAFYLSSWAVWFLLSDRARDTPSRVYCCGLLVVAAFIVLAAVGLYELRKIA